MLNKKSAPLLTALLLFMAPLMAQISTNQAVLKKDAAVQAAREKADFKSLLVKAKEKGWKLTIRKQNSLATLVGVDQFGYPLYVSTENTAQAAATIGTNQLWAGGALGLTLSGSSNNVKGKLAMWDGGRVNNSHVEIQGRVIQKDNAFTLEDHSTHVSGILLGAGINPLAKGMAYGLQEMGAYDYKNHVSEMITAAATDKLLISNHSYTSVAGWFFNDTDNRWEFWGRASENEDYKFGYYSDETEQWDRTAYLAPFYLIVKAAGNNRTQNGPAVGTPYSRYNSSGIMEPAGNRPAGISSNDGYDIISTYGTAKNILTVGAIQPLSGGYTQASDVVIAPFSSWGPTDDGRIKPDLVADGINLLSAGTASDADYLSLSGTSMASPTVAGSALLLQEYYSQLHAGAFMRSATLKGLLIHTADESGPHPGPDYQFGWGVANTQKAAEMIRAAAAPVNPDQLIREEVLTNAQTFTYTVIASGKGSLTATLCWTDPEANEDNSNVLNNRTPKLINDLDIRIKNSSNTYLPWILTPLLPSAAAAKGDNILDNVEKIEIPDAAPGEQYTIEVTHKGTLARAPQAFSLLVSGVGGSVYCTPLLTTGPRITNVQIGAYTNSTSGACNAYRKFPNSTLTIFSGQQLAVNLALGDCSGPATDKIVKLFIDYNQDGDFSDAGETVATSGKVTTAYNDLISVANNLTPGFSTILRIEVKETTDAATITGCGDAGKGEAQDYLVSFIRPDIDISIPGLVSPDAATCPASQLISIRIKNSGSLAQKNIPVSTVVKNGSVTIATFNAVYPGTIAPGKEVIYTYPNRFHAIENDYTFTTIVNFPGDQNSTNNQQATTVSVSGANTPPGNLRAAICGATVLLRATDNSGGQVFWYDSPTATTPIAVGRDTSSKVLPQDKIYYAALNDAVSSVGAKDKTISASGRYSSLANNHFKFTASVPFTIESARMYIGYPGQVRLTVGKVIDATHHQVISSTTVDVYATDPTPQAGEQSYEPADQGALFQLNLSVPQAGEYILIMDCLDGATLLYNNGITTNPYPFTIPEIISINSHNGADNYQRFYLGLYDIGIKLNGCASPRIPVLATDCNEGKDFKIFYGPNPASNGSFSLRFQLGITADLNISIINSMGDRVYAIRYPAFAGNFNQQINISHLKKGLYLIKVEHGGNKYTRKLIVGGTD